MFGNPYFCFKNRNLFQNLFPNRWLNYSETREKEKFRKFRLSKGLFSSTLFFSLCTLYPFFPLFLSFFSLSHTHSFLGFSHSLTLIFSLFFSFLSLTNYFFILLFCISPSLSFFFSLSTHSLSRYILLSHSHSLFLYLLI